ncbi:MAG: hypothetical protein OJF55_001803 [Rhodanobacteraceae bacterium]|jgi:hypothetical protein|nr:MAG: hypothetical protein OJF55_001803 [Rhodanobacteraceae bacterium]
MKQLSMWLTVLLLGCLPLAAAALDYGPNRPLLAAENGAPPLPGAQTQAASPSASPKPDIAEAGVDESPDPAPATLRVAPSASSPAEAAPASRNRGPSASNKPAISAPLKPAIEPDPASWRSLLPGSIQ